MSHFLCIHQTQQAPPDVNVLIVLFFQVLHSRKRTTWETPVQDWWHLQCRRDYSQNASNRTAKDYCSKWKETSWGYFQFTLVHGTLGIVSDPGSVNSREFLQWMTFFFVERVQLSNEHKVLLILNNHDQVIPQITWRMPKPTDVSVFGLT